MEDNAAGEITQFLKEFTEDKISPTTEDDVKIRCGIVGNYSLKPEEVEWEVIDWVFNYLEQRKCPYWLAITLAKKVSQRLSALVFKRLMHTNGEDLGDKETMLPKASSLHEEAISCLQELSKELRDHPDVIDVSAANKLCHTSSVFAIKNVRHKMEDRHVILHDLNAACNLKNTPSHSYYAVFDGHAGVEAANFASAHLHSNLVRNPAFLTDTPKAIIEAFKLTDVQFDERAARENLKSGATAVCALIRESTLYIAWLGDSQALLVKQGIPHTVMDPHKPEREDERKRIEELGGFVVHHGTWRVNGTLAVSRAIGDAEHKPFVSNEPEINVIPLDGTEDFLVIACDGLWDRMTPADVSVALYRHLTDHPHDIDSIAAKLVHQSKQMGSSDNITTIVVFLRDVPSLIANAPNYSAIFPQLEGRSISQMANGSTSRISADSEFSENKYQRPTYFHKDLEPSGVDTLDWSPEMLTGQDRNGKYGVAEGMPPEQTSLSELPTPPIDEVVAPSEFSEYSSAEQLKMFQENLEAQGFHDVSLNEIETSMSENRNFVPSEMQDTMGYLADNDHGDVIKIPKSPSEDIINLQEPDSTTALSPTDVIKDQAAQHIGHKEVFNAASDIVLNTLETAVRHVSSSDSISELSAQTKIASSNPFESDLVDSSISPASPTSPLKSSYQLNPNAEPFVMKDFSSLSPDSLITNSSFSTLEPKTAEMITTTSSVASLESKSVEMITTTSSVSSLDKSSELMFAQDSLVQIEPQNPSSPLPSAPPFEAFGEVEKSQAQDGNPFSAQSTNPFLSSLLGDEVSTSQNHDLDALKMKNSDVLVPERLESGKADNFSGVDVESSLLDSKQSESHILELEQDPYLIMAAEVQNSNLIDTGKLESSAIHTEHVFDQESELLPPDQANDSILMPEELDSSLFDTVNIEAHISELNLGSSNVEQKSEEAIEHEKSANQSISSFESDLLSNSSAGKDVSLTQNVDLKINEGVESSVEDVISKDSLLPKEVQEKLLEVTSSPAPSDAPPIAVAVDLHSIPDGVPEAEGVTEDVDSDSEKDGGWSYVKSSSGSQGQKPSKKPTDNNKAAVNKKTIAAAPKDKKVAIKTATVDVRKTTKSVPGVSDAAKKAAPEKKMPDIKDKKEKASAVSKTTMLTGALKVLPSEGKVLKKSTMPRPISKPATTATKPPTAATKAPTASVVNKTVVTTSKLQPGGAGKQLWKPAHSSTPFKPTIQKSAPSVSGPAKPSSRPASTTALQNNVKSSITSSKPDSTAKAQPRAASAPLASRTLPSTRKIATDTKTSSSANADVKPKPAGTIFRKPLPPTKKPDVKEAKESTNKQIVATKKISQVSTAQVRRVGASATTVKADLFPKKTTTVSSDTKTKTSTMPKGTTMNRVATTAKGKMTLLSKPSSVTAKPNIGKKADEKPSANGPKRLVSAENCPDNISQEMNVEKGILEVNAQETADKLTGASVNPVGDLPGSEIVNKSELKQESNIADSNPLSVAPTEEKV